MKSASKAAPPREDDLKAHIAALGGDVEADYDMVKDVDSEAEVNDDDGVEHDPKLKNDLEKFVKGLNFGAVRGAGVVESDDVAVPRNEQETISHAQDALTITEDKPTKSKFIIPPTPHWYLATPALLPHHTPLPSLSPSLLSSKSTLASALHTNDIAHYTSTSAHTPSASDARFLTRVLASGTLSDRLSALTLLAQASPVHNTRALESLKAMAGKKGREESLKALRAVVDWWVGGGAPDHKLKYFRDQPLTHPDVTEQHLVLWYFEDWLKKYFFSILQLLEVLVVDPLPYVRTQAMTLLFTLLRDKPEQEQNLLRLLVHKLSDSEKSIASKASYLLLQLLQTHPNMKTIIIHDVSALILKPTEGKTHARYYAVITFSQIVLLPGDKEVAARLVDVYLELFREILGDEQAETQDEAPRDFTPKQRRGYRGKQKTQNGKGRPGDLGFHEVQDGNSRLVSQILTGINRALPFAKTENSATFDKHIDTLFRIAHAATFNVNIQALILIQHVAQARPSISDRFYRALYASLVDARLTASSKQSMYLNLLFRALKADESTSRVAAFVRRIVQVLSGQQPAFICGGLYLVGELLGVMGDMTTVVPREQDGDEYDARKRDPQFAHAAASCLWELLPLQQHYHPSVALHVRQLLTHTRVTATADLGLNTLGHFLDRFVYRNPRAPRARGASAMQPGDAVTRPAEEAVNAEAFRKRKEGDVPADQLFFHRFFSKKYERDVVRAGKAVRRKGHHNSADEFGGDEDKWEEQSDADEKEIWKAMQASVPELGGSDVDDDDDESLGGIVEEDDRGVNTEDGHGAPDGSESDFLEDSDDLLSDAADPADLVEYASESASGEGGDEDGSGEDEWQGFGTRPRKRAHTEEEGGKRKRRRGMPTFASYEDYAGMIERDPEDNV